MMVNNNILYILVGGWARHPFEKYESQLGWWHSQYDGKNNPNVPNHQPDPIHNEGIETYQEMVSNMAA